MKATVTPNYTPEQEQLIRDAAAEFGANATTAERLAETLGKSRRSVIAKMVRMDIGYQAKVRTTKSGDPIVSKSDLVAAIGDVVAGNLEGLDKAPKAALIALANFAANA